MTTRVLVTGARGFVGRAIVDRLSRDASTIVRAASRQPNEIGGAVERCRSDELGPDARWTQAVEGVDVVIHSAARVHVMDPRAQRDIGLFHSANVDGTMTLARAAADAGARRFVFLSSIKVNGEATLPGRPFRPDDAPAPVDAYGTSKAVAEERLMAFGETSGMEIVIVRPVLVYGPGVVGNFAAMLSVIDRGIPLPIASIRNARSLVARTNLVELVAMLVSHPAAPKRVFLVSDDDDLSTPDLMRRCASALGRPARLVPVPVPLMRLGGKFLGREGAVQRLCASLQVDIRQTTQLLGWQPIVGVDEALAETARGFRERSGG